MARSYVGPSRRLEKSVPRHLSPETLVTDHNVVDSFDRHDLPIATRSYTEAQDGGGWSAEHSGMTCTNAMIYFWKQSPWVVINMTPAYEQSLQRFVEKREALNARLDATRQEVDSLLYELTTPSVQMLAAMEVLLKQRRDLLAQLAALDDDFMCELLTYLPLMGDAAT